ncbi:hypothetical protein GQ607_009800 [Colletotrichum asianum]|uniref:Uncharacterized protein n=1 Tax=Colletotrichum asianum TaxID=702518 RepID=A0A8H3WBZ8_9PEZI|nr:hypothetical protein GQ607_009800 [Colletotrichum asianum]
MGCSCSGVLLVFSCTSDARCYSAWALRIIDSSAVYILGAGPYFMVL